MKRLGITQRVENIRSYAERRDCLDQRWSLIAQQLGYFPVPLPNIAADQVPILLDSLKLDGVLLSGGNSIARFDTLAEDLAPERDAFESSLLGKSMERNIPVVGVCRGMQLINVELGGQLSSIKGHVAKRHSITQEGDLRIPKIVNSYHNWAIPGNGLADGLKPLAYDLEGNVEAFECSERSLLGIMWHPEREHPTNSLDINLLKRYLL